MFTSYLADRKGEVNHSDRKFEESLYLLDDNYHVIGMRRATNATGPVPEHADYFFSHYPIAPAEKACLDSAAFITNPYQLLFRAGNRPMLAIFEIFPRTGIIVLAVPERQLRKCFDRPATHAAPTEWLHAYDIRLSPAMLSRHAPITTESYNLMHQWLIDMHSAFYYGIDERECDYLVASIAVRLSAQAKLCGLHLSLDLTDLSHDLRDIHELSLILPHSLVTMIAAKRLSRDGTLRLQTEHDVAIGPTVLADFYTAEPQKRIPELEPVRTLAILHNDTFEYAAMPEDPCHVVVRYSLRPAQISMQEVKPSCPFTDGTGATIWRQYRIDPEANESGKAKPIPTLEE